MSRPNACTEGMQMPCTEGMRMPITRESRFNRDRFIFNNHCNGEITWHIHRGVAADELTKRILSDLERSPQVIPLQAGREQPRRYTTPEMWNLEKALLDDVHKLKSRIGNVVSPKTAERALRENPLLSGEQRAAAQKLLTKPQAIRVIQGVAGSGKSTMLKSVVQGFHQDGFKVIGGALAGAAREELSRKTGINSRTVASYLYHLERSAGQKAIDRLKHDTRMLARAVQKKKTFSPFKMKIDRKTVLILDEAGMLDTHSLQRLISHVNKAGATLILCGDTKQLQPIAAGGPLKRIAQEVEKAELSENYRQQNIHDQRAVADIRAGKIDEALLNYAERDRITIGKDGQETIEKLLDHWRQSGGLESPRDHLIFTQTRSEARLINDRCQKERQGEKSRFFGVRSGQETIYNGDRVIFHEAYRPQGIENGMRGTVVGANLATKQLTVLLDEPPAETDSKQSRKKAHPNLVTVPLGLMPKGSVGLGYACTTHKMQGQTVKQASLLLGGPMTTQEMLYVQTTRAQESTQIFIDELHAGYGLEQLIRAARRSQAKDLAHDVVQWQQTERQQTEQKRQLNVSQNSPTIHPSL